MPGQLEHRHMGIPGGRVHWYDGGMKSLPPDGVLPNALMRRDGLLFTGESSTMVSGFYESARPPLLAPDEKFQDFQPPARTLRRCDRDDHYTEWTTASKTAAETVCLIEFGCGMPKMSLLGALALRARMPLEWDAKAMRATNYGDVNRHVDPPYRAGWQL